jgi:hypothetical protein
MANKKYRLLDGAPDDWPKAADGVTPLERGSEFEDDFDAETEQAIVAAGWAELATSKEAKGGKK